MDEGLYGFFIGAALVIILAGALWTRYSITTPSAMDVYQGKTTLEITYKDSIPVDSVVVFK